MQNPYLPKWEYIPDGEPRVFGDRVYVYGSHDKAGSDEFCDYVLKCWSAPVSDLTKWVCHGDIFRVKETRDHKSDTDWTNDKTRLFAPDVVCKDGKYYLYAYIVNAKGCVAVSDKPEGPFKLLSKYSYTIPDDICCNGWFIDPGVLVDDDGRVYIYCGYLRSFLAEVNPDNMYEILDGTCVQDFIPNKVTEQGGFDSEEKLFFEAASMRKIGNTYYMIYSPKHCSRLAYATSESPTGPFSYRGYIVDNGVDYPGGNDHGSIAEINGEWYIFYHRMTNGSIMSRRGCVEKIKINPDGSIDPVEMTSGGFEKSLNPYEITPADIACVLTGSAKVTELNVFDRVITDIRDGAVIGYKYFDFGDDFGSKTMDLAVKYRGLGADAWLNVYVDGLDDGYYEYISMRKNAGKAPGPVKEIKDEEKGDSGSMIPKTGHKIGSIRIGHDGGVAETAVEAVTGIHALYFTVTTDYKGWTAGYFKERNLLEIEKFVFMK